MGSPEWTWCRSDRWEEFSRERESETTPLREKQTTGKIRARER